MHKVSFDRRTSTAHNAVVNIVNRGNSTRPIILVLGSDEPVNWILNLPGGLTISKVILVRIHSHNTRQNDKYIIITGQTSRSSYYFLWNVEEAALMLLKRNLL